eukprot:3941673-Rhodomonas_salina.4
MPGTDVAYTATRAWSVSGTDIACGTICCRRTRCLVLTCAMSVPAMLVLTYAVSVPAICYLLSAYAMNGTDIAYAAICLLSAYAMPGTDIAYAASRFWVTMSVSLGALSYAPTRCAVLCYAMRGTDGAYAPTNRANLKYFPLFLVTKGVPLELIRTVTPPGQIACYGMMLWVWCYRTATAQAERGRGGEKSENGQREAGGGGGGGKKETLSSGEGGGEAGENEEEGEEGREGERERKKEWWTDRWMAVDEAKVVLVGKGVESLSLDGNQLRALPDVTSGQYLIRPPMSGTDIAYGPTVCYAMSVTDLAYAATRQRMGLRSLSGMMLRAVRY